MLELLKTPDDRYACYAIVPEDLASPEGRDIYLQYRSLLSREHEFDEEEKAELLEAATEIFDEDKTIHIVAWSAQEQGVVGGELIEKKDTASGIAHAVGSYVRSDVRGDGISKFLHQASIHHLRSEGFKMLTADIVDTNEAAIQSAVGQGFRLTGRTVSNHGMPAGQYSLDLTQGIVPTVKPGLDN